MNRNRAEGGFTLVELMVVLVIMGLLAMMGIPRYREMTDRARISTAKSDLDTAMQGIWMYAAENDSLSYPTTSMITSYDDLRSVVLEHVGMLPNAENSRYTFVSYAGSDTSFAVVVRAHDSARTTIIGNQNGITITP